MIHSLGRVVQHDEQSRNFPARRAAQPQTVLWRHTAQVLDQGDLGACTGFALAQCLNARMYADARPKRRHINSVVARGFYSLATQLDPFPGQWPPQDTGSSGLAVCKAGVHRGYLSGYDHAFGFEHFCAALQLQPVIVGTYWYDAMFDPDTNGLVHKQGSPVGGHEYTALGVNYQTQLVTFLNSWGPRWGRNGRFYMTFQDFAALLAEQGDVTVPVGKWRA